MWNNRIGGNRNWQPQQTPNSSTPATDGPGPQNVRLQNPTQPLSQFMQFSQSLYSTALGNLPPVSLQNMHVVQVPLQNQYLAPALESYVSQYGHLLPTSRAYAGQPPQREQFGEKSLPKIRSSMNTPGVTPASQNNNNSNISSAPPPSSGVSSYSYYGVPVEPESPSPAPENNSDLGVSSAPPPSSGVSSYSYYGVPVEPESPSPAPENKETQLSPTPSQPSGGPQPGKVNMNPPSGQAAEAYEEVDVRLRTDEVRKAIKDTIIFAKLFSRYRTEHGPISVRGLEDFFKQKYHLEKLCYVIGKVERAGIFGDAPNLTMLIARNLAAMFVADRRGMKGKMEEVVDVFKKALENVSPPEIDHVSVGGFGRGPIGQIIKNTTLQVRPEKLEQFGRNLAKLDKSFAETISNVSSVEDLERVLEDKESLRNFRSTAIKKSSEEYVAKRFANDLSYYVVTNPQFEFVQPEVRKSIARLIDRALKEVAPDAEKKT